MTAEKRGGARGSTLRERALRLLARREHSRVELARKLAPHAECEEALIALLDDLAARRLLSDERYAEMRVNARGSRYGDARLAHELRTQGVDAEIVAEALATGGDEFERARLVWQRKFGSPAADPAGRARQMRFLMSRGFAGATIRRILRGDLEDD